MTTNSDLEMANLTAKLLFANKELALQSAEKTQLAVELLAANKELAIQSAEKAMRAAELVIANKELAIQSAEKAMRAAELVIANKELALESVEKHKRAAELVIANKELALESVEKAKRAAELLAANKELALGTKERAMRAAELLAANKELAIQSAEIARKAEELATINKDLASQVEMESLAFYDPLTNLPNRRLLFDRLTQKLASSVRTHEYGALFFIDLDHFKILNDTYGHAMGDLLLQRVAERLSGNIRSSDTAARLGGDEFVLLLNDLSRDHTDAIRQAQVAGNKLLKTLSASYQLGESTHHITASVGITIFGNLPIIAEDLLQQADTAMYDAKNMGRNTLSFFSSKLVIEKIK